MLVKNTLLLRVMSRGGRHQGGVEQTDDDLLSWVLTSSGGACSSISNTTWVARHLSIGPIPYFNASCDIPDGLFGRILVF